MIDAYPCYDPLFIEEILSMYLLGVPIATIGMYMGTSVEEVNVILDYFTPFLD